MKRLSPIKYYGAKNFLVERLLQLMPPHRVYVEPFLGSGAVAIAKEPATVEVLNDIDGEVVNFFQVLRDPNLARQLRDKLELTPYSRGEYGACVKASEVTTDPAERARAFFVRCNQSLNGRLDGHWSRDKGSNRTLPFYRALDLIEPVCRRLRACQIENKDFEDVIGYYDSPETLFFADPPYLPEARESRGQYKCEMTYEDHERLLRCLTDAKGMVILSGYAHPLYNRNLENWKRIDVRVPCLSGINPKTGKRTRRVESIWLNPAAIEAKARQKAAMKAAREAA